MPDNARYERTILGTCCVPWQEDGTLAEDIFRRSIRALFHGGLRDLYIFGTAGEGYAVDEALFDEVTRVFVSEMVALQARPMVGVISLSLRTVISRIERAAALGVPAFQVSLPSWGALSDAEVPIFFREVCGRFRELQFLHYNLPRSGRLVSARHYAALAEAHPNLVATKYGGGDTRMIAELLTIAPQLRHFLTEAGFAAGCVIGEPGYLISFAASNLRRARAYFEAGVARDVTTLGAMQAELTGLHQELTGAVGSAPHGPHMDGAYDKLFCKLQDPHFPLRLLPPYLGATDAVFDRYHAALRTRFPQWLAAPTPDRPNER